MKFIKKPVVIEAKKYEESNLLDLMAWINAGQREYGKADSYWSDDKGFVIPTLEGEHVASLGDWIIEGVAGEFYPCKPDIFEATYEPA